MFWACFQVFFAAHVFAHDAHHVDAVAGIAATAGASGASLMPPTGRSPVKVAPGLVVVDGPVIHRVH